MPNNCLSVLYKHVIQVENKNLGLKVGEGTNIPLPPNQKSVGGVEAHAPHPPASYASAMYCILFILIKSLFKFINFKRLTHDMKYLFKLYKCVLKLMINSVINV